MISVKSLTFKYKLIIVVVFTTLIAILLSFMANVYLERSFHERKLVEEGMTQAKLLTEFSITPLDFGYKDEAGAIVAKLETNPRVLNCVIFDKDGKVFTSYSKKRLEYLPPISNLDHYSNFTENYLHIFNKIRYKGKVKGTLYLRISTTELEEELMVAWIYKISILLVMIIVVIIISSYLLKPISTPIEKLTEVTKSITENEDFSFRLIEKGAGEIATLYKSFNKMLETINQREIERDKAESERKRVIKIIENTSDMVSMGNPEKSIIYLNEAGYKLLGWDKKRDITDYQIEDVHPTWANEILMKSRLPKAVKRGIWVGENTVLNGDGEEVPVSQVILAHKDEKDNILYYSTIIRDITEQKKQEADLTYLKQYLSNIIDSMPLLLIGVDYSGIVTQWNIKAELLSGVSKENAIGYNLYSTFPRMLELQDQIIDSIRSNEVKKQLNRPYIEAENTLYEDLTIFPIISEGEKSAIIILSDVTKEFEMTNQLNQRSKMDAIGQLAGGIAHDFNNMLSGIIGAADLLKVKLKKEDNETELSYLNLISNSVGKAADLTNKLLTFARKGKTVSVAVDIHKIITETSSILSRTIDKRINIKLDLSASNCVVLGEFSRLQSSFINLGINSSHAIEGEGEILIQTKNIELEQLYCKHSPFDIMPGEYIAISVRDSGSGISPEHIKKIFEPFFTTKEAGKGTGLGLAAVYGTIQEHNGAITANSELGEGSVFHIYLPCSDEKLVERDLNLEMHVGTGKILLIDDEEIIRITGESMLEALGYETLVAHDGRDGVEQYQKEYKNIDLVIVDMIMPVMNGRETFEKILEINPKAKVIISSGFTKDENLDELVKLGLSGFIKKPYNISELSQEIVKVLG